MVSEQDVRTALVAVIDPEIRRSVVELDMVRGVAIDGGRVDVTLALTVAGCPMKANLEQQRFASACPAERPVSSESCRCTRQPA
jgi:ATP-binding protein involved in chromosome partitioning